MLIDAFWSTSSVIVSSTSIGWSRFSFGGAITDRALDTVVARADVAGWMLVAVVDDDERSSPPSEMSDHVQ